MLLSHLEVLTKLDLADLQTIAGDDAIKDLFSKIPINDLQRIIQEMIRRLIRDRKLEHARLLEEYYMVALDATGLFHRHAPHCKHCLIKKASSGEVLYSHNVLEAKLITESGLALSMTSEHIENQDDDSFDLSTEKGKQDCEIKAFKRLAPKIKAAFPQLKICLLLDSLYAAAPVMDICKQNGWAFNICFKEGSIPSVFQEFESLLPLQKENRRSWETKSAHQKISWVTGIDYQGHVLHLIECIETCKASGETKRFLYLTNLKPTFSNVCALANGAGRQRWKIENQGFNMQKHGGYNLEHVYTEDENAAKCLYLCLQIAHIINQLIEHGSLITNAVKTYGSLKNLTRALLDALRFISITPDDIKALLAAPFQIRLKLDST